MPQGVSLPPREASVTSSNFDEHLNQEKIILNTPYPGDTVQIHNLLF
jgi:hypothetical protein